MKTRIILALTALTMGSMISCSDNNKLIETQEPAEPAAQKEAPVCYINLTASIGDATTKALTIDDNATTFAFEASDKVYVYIERAGTTPAFGYDAGALIPLTIDNINGATCDLSGALKFYYSDGGLDYDPYVPNTNDVVHLLYNPHNPYSKNLPCVQISALSGAKNGYVDPVGFGDPDDYYWGADHFDCAEAVMIVTNVDVDVNSNYTLTLGKVGNTTDNNVSFKNLQSMFRQNLTLKDAGNNTVTPTITKFRINSSNNRIIYHYFPFYDNNSPLYYYYGTMSSDPYLDIMNPVIDKGDIYFPLMFNDENKGDALILSAYDNAGNVYSVTKNAPVSGFANGKYYYGSSTLTWQKCIKPTVIGTAAEPGLDGTYAITEDPVNLNIGGNSEDYCFELGHGGTVTLNNLTAMYSNGTFINSADDILVNLIGTNSINSYDDCIVASGGSIKLSCTGTSATLTVTSAYDTYCGIYGANYTPSDDSTDPTANMNGTTTQLDVTAQLAAPGFTVTRSARVDGPDADSDGNPDYYTWTYTVEDHRVQLNNLSGNYVAQNGDWLMGTLESNYQISIADGATVTLAGVSINADGAWDNDAHAGITCLGDATIILADGTTNTVKGFGYAWPGIYVPGDYFTSTYSTLTIQGTGTLNACAIADAPGIGGSNSCDGGNIVILSGIINATGNDQGAGIGAGNGYRLGTITISGGTVTATAGSNQGGAGIGTSGVNSYCGDIIINGGIVTAIGGQCGPGIGAGLSYCSCGEIRIATTITSVTAIKGGNTPYYDGSNYQYYNEESHCIGGVYGGPTSDINCYGIHFGNVKVYDYSLHWSNNMPTQSGTYGGLYVTVSNTNSHPCGWDTWTLTPTQP